MEVIKRDGRVVKYDSDKIIVAKSSANKDVKRNSLKRLFLFL